MTVKVYNIANKDMLTGVISQCMNSGLAGAHRNHMRNWRLISDNMVTDCFANRAPRGNRLPEYATWETPSLPTVHGRLSGGGESISDHQGNFPRLVSRRSRLHYHAGLRAAVIAPITAGVMGGGQRRGGRRGRRRAGGGTALGPPATLS